MTLEDMVDAALTGPVVLVACVKGKQSGTHPAGELYTSPWFTKAKTYAEREGSSWAILSAKHGLVQPSDRVATYNQTLAGTRVAVRRSWAARVAKQIGRTYPGGTRLVMLAGVSYRGELIKLLDDYTIEVPMAGMGNITQMAWLNRQNG